MKDVKGKDNVDNKVLISMQTPEANLNPFYSFGDENGDYSALHRGKTSSMFAYSFNLSSMFENLHTHNQIKESLASIDHENIKNKQETKFAGKSKPKKTFALFDDIGQQQNTSRGSGDLDIIRENPLEENSHQAESSELLKVNDESDTIKRPNKVLTRRMSLISEQTTRKLDESSDADELQDEQTNPDG